MDALVRRIGNIDIQITYRCNLNCLHCYNQADVVPDMDVSTACRIIDDAHLVGFPEVHITGGEPCLHKMVIEILRFAGSQGLSALLETNGTKPDLIPSLEGINGLKIRASIEGDESTHNKIRPSYTFNPFRTTVAFLYQAQSIAIPIQATCSVNRLNHANVYAMVASLAENGVTDIRLRLTMPAGQALQNWNALKLSPFHLYYKN